MLSCVCQMSGLVAIPWAWSTRDYSNSRVPWAYKVGERISRDSPAFTLYINFANNSTASESLTVGYHTLTINWKNCWSSKCESHEVLCPKIPSCLENTSHTLPDIGKCLQAQLPYHILDITHAHPLCRLHWSVEATSITRRDTEVWGEIFKGKNSKEEGSIPLDLGPRPSAGLEWDMHCICSGIKG